VSRVNIAIAVVEDARLGIYEVAAACRAFGFEHLSTLPDIGVLTGSAELEMLPRLRRLPGVVAVEIERELEGKTALRAGRRPRRCPRQRPQRSHCAGV